MDSEKDDLNISEETPNTTSVTTNLYPPPLDPDVFLTPDFHPDAFLTARRHLLPADLRSDLRAYLAQRRNELVQVINDDYEDFLSLSNGVKGVDTLVQNLEQTLLQARTRLTEATSPLQDINATINEKLGQRAKLREHKAALRLLTSIEESILSLESLLLIPHPHDSTYHTSSMTKSTRDKSSLSSSSSSSSTRRIERIASEYNHLLYLANKGNNTKLVKLFQPRIDRISSALQQDLNNLLLSRLQHPSPNQSQQSEYLLECLRSYSFLNRQKDAEQVFRQSIIHPWVSANITRSFVVNNNNNQQQQSSPPPTPDSDNNDNNHQILYRPLSFPLHPSFETDPLTILYNNILHFIASSNCSLVLQIINSSLPKSGLNFVANVIWDEVASRLVSELGQIIFAVGDPDRFFKHYTITTKFVSCIQNFCLPEQLVILKSHPIYKSFHKRWQLPIYFQFRFKEIVHNLESEFDPQSNPNSKSPQLSSNQDNNNSSDNRKTLASDINFFMSFTTVTYAALVRCWDPNVYIPDLCALFWKLSLQILSRYQTAIKADIAQYITIPTTSQSSSKSTPTQSAAPSARSSSDSKRPPIGTNEGYDDLVLNHLASAISDLASFQSHASQLFDKQIQPQLSLQGSMTTTNANKKEQQQENVVEKHIANNAGSDGDIDDDSPKAVWKEILDSTNTLIPDIETQIVQIIFTRCSEPLRLVRSTITRVRNSTINAAEINEPSYFVHSILKPLKSFLFESDSGSIITNDDIKKRWAILICEKILTKYTSNCSDMKKQEESLRRLKKGRSGALSIFGKALSSGSSNQSDSEQNAQDERVKVQMLKDVDFLVQDAQNSFGISLQGEILDTLKGVIEGTSNPTT